MLSDSPHIQNARGGSRTLKPFEQLILSQQRLPFRHPGTCKKYSTLEFLFQPRTKWVYLRRCFAVEKLPLVSGDYKVQPFEMHNSVRVRINKKFRAGLHQ